MVQGERQDHREANRTGVDTDVDPLTRRSYLRGAGTVAGSSMVMSGSAAGGGADADHVPGEPDEVPFRQGILPADSPIPGFPDFIPAEPGSVPPDGPLTIGPDPLETGRQPTPEELPAPQETDLGSLLETTTNNGLDAVGSVAELVSDVGAVEVSGDDGGTVDESGTDQRGA